MNPQHLSTVDSASSATCVDTPGWKNIDGFGCESYSSTIVSCLEYGDIYGNMGPASEHCCYCNDHTVS